MTLALVKVSGAALSLLLWPFLGGSTQGQTINDVAGFYRLVAIDNVRPNGEVVQQYGPNPKGALSLDPERPIRPVRPTRPTYQLRSAEHSRGIGARKPCGRTRQPRAQRHIHNRWKCQNYYASRRGEHVSQSRRD